MGIGRVRRWGKGIEKGSRREPSLGPTDFLYYKRWKTGKQVREKLSETWGLEQDWQLFGSMGGTASLQISHCYHINKGNFSPYGLLSSVFFLMSILPWSPVTLKLLVFHQNIWPLILYIISCVVPSLGKTFSYLKNSYNSWKLGSHITNSVKAFLASSGRFSCTLFLVPKSFVCILIIAHILYFNYLFSSPSPVSFLSPWIFSIQESTWHMISI